MYYASQLKRFSNLDITKNLVKEFHCLFHLKESIGFFFETHKNKLKQMVENTTRHAAHFNNRGEKYHACLHSQFKIVKYRRSARIGFIKRSKFGYYQRFPLFCFLKGRL